MNFNFNTHGMIIYGMPYVAKITLDVDNTLKKEFIEADTKISVSGEVDINVDYEVNNYDIIEERHGSMGNDTLASYSIAYRNKLITLGEVGNKELEGHIINYLDSGINLGEILNSIDEMYKLQFEKEINEILNSKREKVFTDKNNKNYINILAALKTFINDNEYLILQFSDFHVIFESECEKIMMRFINDNNVYIETQTFKVNIMLDKIESYDAVNSKYDFTRINIRMTDGATISLIKAN